MIAAILAVSIAVGADCKECAVGFSKSCPATGKESSVGSACGSTPARDRKTPHRGFLSGLKRCRGCR